MFIVPLLIWGAVMVVTALTYKKSKIVMSFWLFFISISLMMLSAVAFATKQTSYQFPLGIDYTLYLAFYKIKLSINDILRIYCFSFGIYFFSNVISLCIVQRVQLWHLFLELLPAALFLIFNEPSMSRVLYIQAYADMGVVSVASSYLMKVLPLINLVIVLFYACCPIALGVIKAFTSQIRTRRRLLIYYSVLVGMIDLFVLAIFVFGSFGQILFHTAGKTGVYPMLMHVDYTYAPLGLLVVFFMIMIVILVYPHPFRVLYRMYEKRYINPQETSESFAKHLHGDRNFLIALAQYLKVAEVTIQNDHPETAGIHIQNALGMIEEQLNVTNRQMSLARKNHIILRFENIEKIISDAMDKAAIPPDISCSVDYPKEHYFVIGDREHLTEVFVNIFRNAVEALKEASAGSPCISVRLIAEYNLCCAFITDNGIGIQPEEMKRIFHPFYTTKSSLKNSGIGLSYASEIINKHNGEIYVRSRRGAYTEFAIVLPIVIKRRAGVLL